MSKINFNYKRSDESLKQRAAGKSKNFRSLIDETTCTLWTPEPGSYHIRILPPHEDDSYHWGEEAHIHYQVGASKQRYLCPERMGKTPSCPICEFNRSQGMKDWWPNRSVLIRFIDRNDPEGAIKAWFSPRSQFDQALTTGSRLLDSGATMVRLDDPVNGRDVKFIRQGTGVRDTQYTPSICEPSPLGDADFANKILDVVRKHPLESLFNFVDVDTLRQELGMSDVPAATATASPAPAQETTQAEQPPVQQTQAEAEAAFESGEAESTDYGF